MKRRLSEAQILCVDILTDWYAGMEEVKTEYQWADGRRWRFDVAIPSLMLAFELDGGKWSGGHRRGNALEADYERQNAAILDGWKLFRFTNDQAKNGYMKNFIEENL